MEKKLHGISLKELIADNLSLVASEKMRDYEDARLDRLTSEALSAPLEQLRFQVIEALRSSSSHVTKASAAYFAAAVRFDDEQRQEEAIFLYRLSHYLVPNPKAINNLAVIYADSGREENALAILQEGLALFPADKTIQENYGALR